MTLIDDARYDLFFEMIEANDYTGYTWLRCRVCGVDDGKHEDGCTVPRIVAALEAAERVAERNPYHGQSSMGATVCGFCGEEIGMFWEEDGARHWGDCPWLALVAALRGEEVVPTPEGLTGTTR